VLEFFQQDDNQRQHKLLNIVFSTMRWWNMPMLYSYNYVKSDTKRKRDDLTIENDRILGAQMSKQVGI
jgi:hypothetical protein